MAGLKGARPTLRGIIRSGIGLAARHPRLRRAAMAVLAPVPSLRVVLVRVAAGGMSMRAASGRAASGWRGGRVPRADRRAEASLGRAARLVAGQLRGAMQLHGD